MIPKWLRRRKTNQPINLRFLFRNYSYTQSTFIHLSFFLLFSFFFFLFLTHFLLSFLSLSLSLYASFFFILSFCFFIFFLSFSSFLSFLFLLFFFPFFLSLHKKLLFLLDISSVSSFRFLNLPIHWMVRVFTSDPGDHVQPEVESYQIFKRWYLMPPCLTLGIIRYRLRVKWCNPEKGVSPFLTPWCSSHWKGTFGLPSTTVGQLYIYIYIYI